MNIKELFTEDRGVSPVIGVILMVAITVILAAVIGAFVLGLGESASETTPQASISFDFQGTENVTLAHEGGQSLANDSVTVTLNENEYNTSTWGGGGDDISAGDEMDLWVANGSEGSLDASTGDTVRVIWTGSDSSNTIASGDFP